jgi:hypothetical protein
MSCYQQWQDSDDDIVFQPNPLRKSEDLDHVLLEVGIPLPVEREAVNI